MRPFSCILICTRNITVTDDIITMLCPAFKFNAVPDQFPDDLLRTADHNIDRFFSVLIMPRTHRIFKITVIITFIAQNADSALCQK